MRHNLGLYPYKLQTNQMMSEGDKRKRVEFGNLILSDSVNLENILWTDESYFTLTGHVFRHSSIIWGTERPRTAFSIDMHCPKVCVWFGFSAHCKLTPFFFPGTVTGENYAEMLQTHVFPQLRTKNELNSVVFQQDGAPPHYARVVRALISSVFPDERVISRGYPQNWPAHSPDLSPLDFYFWGTIKSRVYFNFTPTTLDELRERISSVIDQVDQEELRRAVLHLPYRLEFVLENDGEAIEHLL